MNLQRSFLVCSYALLATSFVMLCGTRRIDVVTMLLFAAALVCGWLIDAGKLVWGLRRRPANALMLCGLLAAVVAWQLLHVLPITVIVNLTLFAATLKLLRWKSGRDWLWLYLVSFCLVLMTAGLMMDALFFVLLVIYLFTAALALAIHELRRAQLELGAAQAEPNAGATSTAELEFWCAQKTGLRRANAPRPRRLASAAALLLLTVLALALPLFLAMPRVAHGAGRGSWMDGNQLSGFTDTVRLGEVAQVKLNPQVVMRVRVTTSTPLDNVAGLPEEPARQWRWRGVTLDRYENRTWQRSSHNPRRVRPDNEGFWVSNQSSDHPPTTQQFLVEPLGINTVFVAPRPVFIAGLSALDRDGGDGLWTEDHSFQKLSYTVYSDTYVPNDAELLRDNARNYPNDILRYYLQLPEGFDRRLQRLAEEVTRGATTTLESARRVERYLSTSYGYSLDLRRVEDGDPIADFLFNVKEGHCEYFASAMVLLLRARGIPARLVNGFQTGEYNPQSGFFTVRQSDAHSWVEVYFTRHGWVTFDPTPPAGLNAYDHGWLAWWRQWREATEMAWLEHVVGFDTGKQLALLRQAQLWVAARQLDLSVRWPARWSGWLQQSVQQVGRWRDGNFNGQAHEFRPALSEWSRLLPWVLGLVGVVGLFFAVHQRRTGWRRRLKQEAPASAAAFYQQMLRALARRGVQRPPYQTPMELAAQLDDPRVAELTRLYERARFGEQELTDAEIARVDALLRALKKG